MANYLSPIGNAVAFVDSNGSPRASARLFTYASGSSSKQTTYTNNLGSASNTNPIVLDSSGYAPEPIWLIGGNSYKFLLAPPGVDDPPSSTLDSWDNISGINDASVSVDQWIAGPTPTYVSTTQFTLAGDQTSEFHVGRRLKLTISASTVYGRITVSAFTVLTTVTVVLDSGVLDVGLSAVAYGILGATNQSADVTAITRAMNKTGDTMTGDLVMSGASIDEAAEVDVASATPNIGAAASNNVRITGTTTITAFDTVTAGISRKVRFQSGLVLTYNATSLILPTSANITTLANDSAEFVSLGSGNWFCRYYKRQDGRSLASTPVDPNIIPLGILKAGSLDTPQNATRFLTSLGMIPGATEANHCYYCPAPITVSKLYVKLSANVAGGESVVITLRKNSADTAVTTTITAGNSTGNDTTHSVYYSEGDTLAIKVVTSATFGSTTDINASVVCKLFNSNIGAPMGFCWNNLGDAAGGTNSRNGEPGNANRPSSSYCQVPLSQTVISRFYVDARSASDVEIRKNNVAMFTALNAAGAVNTNGILFDAQDTYQNTSPTTGGQSAGHCHAQPALNTLHPYPYAPTFFSSLGQVQNTTVYMGGYLSDPSATESDVQLPVAACIVSTLRATCDTAPVAGQTVTLTVRKNGVDTALTCQLTNGGGTLAADTSNSVTFVAGDILTVKCVSSATVGTRDIHVSLNLLEPL